MKRLKIILTAFIEVAWILICVMCLFLLAAVFSAAAVNIFRWLT